MDDSTAFPAHVFDTLGVDPLMHAEPIGGTIRVVEKRPPDGPIVMMTIGASLLPTDSGERVELAVETIEGQQGAAIIAMKIVCDDMAANRRVPPIASPWRNSEPFLTGTRISAIMATPSRWGDSFAEVRSSDGAVVGHVRMLRLLTDAEASFARVNRWEALVAAAGSVDALLDVTRADAVAGAGLPGDAPVFLSKMHADHPPRWVTFTGNDLESFTGLETDEYMEDAANREIWSYSSFSARYPWVEGFVNAARPGQTALFTDRSGAYELEDD